ncbi:MAG: TerB family tellurite resistance protein [Pseudomonadota bacterium]
MFERVIALLANGETEGPDGYSSKDVAAAVCALYFHMIQADGVVKPVEIDQFRKSLQDRFELSDDELNATIEEGVTEDQNSPGLFPFTAILNRELTEVQKSEVLEQLENLARLDGEVHPLETDMLEHVRRLLKLPPAGS